MMAIWGTVVTSDFPLKTKSGNKYQETIYTGNIIRYFHIVIFCW